MRENTRATLAKLLLALYLVVLIFFVFFSDARSLDRGLSFNFIPFKTIYTYYVLSFHEMNFDAWLVNVVGNLAMLAPLGVLLPLAWKKFNFSLKIIVASLAVSLTIEGIQWLSRNGSVDIDDLLINTVGALLGFLFFKFFDSSSVPFSTTAWNLKDCVIFLDVDGTLVGDAGNKVDKETLKVFHELKRHNTIFLCSNSPHRERTRTMARELGVECNSGSHKKPHKEVLKDFDIPKNKRLVVIGNLHCIDGRFAKAIGADFYPVKTLLGEHDRGVLDRLFYFLDCHLFSKCI